MPEADWGSNTCNADFHYTDKMMSFAYDRFLPDGMRWRDIFDMVSPPGCPQIWPCMLQSTLSPSPWLHVLLIAC